MNVFRELRIALNGLSAAEGIALLEGHAGGGWRRDPAFEGRVRPAAQPYGCFVFHGSDLSPISLWIVARQPPERLEVSNIISERKGELSCGEYNLLLENFHRHVAAPAAQASAGRMTLDFTPASTRLEEVMPPPVAEKLRRFSASANKSAGASHPSDLARWVDFLTELHRRGNGVSPSLLRRWLVEEENWPVDTAAQLATEYEFAQELLTAYDRKRA